MSRTPAPQKDNQPADNGEGSQADAERTPSDTSGAAPDPAAPAPGEPPAPPADAETNVGKAGLKAAENHLAETDEEVTLAWDISGPRSGRVERIGAFMHSGRIVLAMVYKSGKFKIFAPQDAAPPTV